MLNGMLIEFKDLPGRSVTILSGSILHSEGSKGETEEHNVLIDIKVVCTGSGGVEIVHQKPRSFFQVHVDKETGGIQPGTYLAYEGTIRF